MTKGGEGADVAGVDSVHCYSTLCTAGGSVLGRSGFHFILIKIVILCCNLDILYLLSFTGFAAITLSAACLYVASMAEFVFFLALAVVGIVLTATDLLQFMAHLIVALK